MLRVARDFLDVLLDTEEFFRQDRSPGQALGYFSFLSGLTLGASWLLLLAGISPAVVVFERILGPGQGYWLALGFFLSGFAFLGLYAALLGRFLEVAFSRAFRVAAYGLTPALVTLWIPFLGIVCLGWSLYLQAMGLSVLGKAGLRRNAIACAKAGGIVILLEAGFLLLVGVAILASGGRSLDLLWTIVVP